MSSSTASTLQAFERALDDLPVERDHLNLLKSSIHNLPASRLEEIAACFATANEEIARLPTTALQIATESRPVIQDGASFSDSQDSAFFGEGVVFKGSITAPERIVVHGTIEGDLLARDLLVGPNGTIKGNVRVDQADIQGSILQSIEARVCLSLRKTGSIQGSVVYGDIEIERGGFVGGEICPLKGTVSEASSRQRTIAFDTIRSVASQDATADRNKKASYTKIHS